MTNKYVKYARTLHFSWSHPASDDKILPNVSCFHGKEVVVSEKIDGENSTLYNDHYHARSLTSSHHPSRTWIKNFHSQIRHNIPANLRICGENVYAKHTIFYNELTTYFYVFSIWEDNICLSWNETLEWCELLGLETAPVLYQGMWNETKIKECWTGKSLLGGKQEGYVVRITDRFNYEDFGTNVAKYVNSEFKQAFAEHHWSQYDVVPNLLKKY